jgi:AraC-like DNA-binding protein
MDNQKDSEAVIQFLEEIQPKIRYFVFRKSTPQWGIKSRISSSHCITYIIKGRARFVINNKSYAVSAGDLICNSIGDLKSAHTFPEDLMQCFSVNFIFTDKKMDGIRLPFPVTCHIGLNEDVVHWFYELLYAWTDQIPGYTIRLKGLLFLILHRIFVLTVNDAGPAIDYRIKKVIQYIVKHYSEKISVKGLAGLLGLNTAYFGQLFRQEMKMSISQYLTRTRIRQAASMLQSGEYGVAEAAENAGFGDTYYFYKQFKKVMGIPPSKCIPKRKGYIG